MKRDKRIQLLHLILFLLLLNNAKLYACGNEYYTPPIPLSVNKLELNSILLPVYEMSLPYWTNIKGDNLYEYRDSLYNLIFNAKGKYKIRKQVRWEEIQQAIDKKLDYRLLSDFAWYELKLYNKKNAVRFLEELYRQHPQEYNIMANLGTAYEVIGKNKDALNLLRKAVAINPASHYNSEWIHIKILEQKISGNNDYAGIINLGINDFGKWLKEESYQYPQNPDSLLKQIAYQLHERTSFIKPPDKIIGYLVFDFANIVCKEYGSEKAKEFYEYAVSYDSALSKKLPAAINISEQIVTIENKETKAIAPNIRSSNKVILVLAFALATFIIVIFIRKRVANSKR